MSHAIVMGGSIAGLCAAAALARNFGRVTVIERDAKPGPDPRRSVPQAHHAHTLMRRGQQIMAALLPGAFEDLEGRGARRVDAGTGFRLFQFGAWKRQAPVELDMWMQSRATLEHCLRERLAQLPNVELRHGMGIETPIHERGRIVGVILRNGVRLDAELVVDAMGRGSRSQLWLRQWGYAPADEQRVEIGVGYVSGVFELPAGRPLERGVAVYPLPPDTKRLGLACPIEAHAGAKRMVVTLAGYHGDHPPTELSSFRAWARSLLQPDIADLLERATLVGELHEFGCREQVRRAFGSRPMPEAYLVVGDAMCHFDPTFGQGMTVAAMQAEQLLRLRPGKATRPMQRRLARLTKLPFAMTANEAHRWAQTRGWQPPLGAVQRWYIARVFEAAASDAEVYRRLIRAMHFVAGPASLFAPGMIARLCRHALRQHSRSAALPSRELSLELPPALSSSWS